MIICATIVVNGRTMCRRAIPPDARQTTNSSPNF
jgi:hypothetical protein